MNTNYIEMARRLSDIHRAIMSIEDLAETSKGMPADNLDEILVDALKTKEALSGLANAVHRAEFACTEGG